MKTCHAILLLITGVILLIGGLFATSPQALQPSPTLTRMSPDLAPWLLIAGGLTGVLGMVGLIGVFPPHFLQSRPGPADRPDSQRERRAAGPARPLLHAKRGV